ncbi:MAG: Uma2 family endonuclease [Gemmatimonadales bacterium]|nr:Uma2 family endonuclease [Gemmatimonadales bacterium]
MGMPDLVSLWTRDNVLGLPDDGNRYELVDGELVVTPSPSGRHQLAVWTLYDLIKAYVREHGIGRAGTAPADLDLRAGQLLQPDLFVGAAIEGRAPVEWNEWGVPLLVAEVLSPSTARHDRVTKRRLYQRSGVPAYWIVDFDARLVEVWTPADRKPAIVDDMLTWHADPSIPPLLIDLPAYFREVWPDT